MLATAAVPGILNPVVLMQKLKTGRLVPWNWGSKFKDGSLRSVKPQGSLLPRLIVYDSCRVDIPLQVLHLLFNGRWELMCPMSFDSILSKVTHPVVAQANPHVHLFFFAPRGSAGKPVAHRKNKGMIKLVIEFLLS